MKPLELPPGLLSVPLGKGTVLVLTREEYRRGLRRGKFYRRGLALAGRLATQEGEPIPAIGPEGIVERGAT